MVFYLQLHLFLKSKFQQVQKKLPLKSYNFSGLKELSSDKKGALYRYYYGNTDTYLTAQKLKEEAVKRGYNSAFIVAFKNGQKVPLASVIKSTSN
jgi:N-acetylmuramoyl-L-alanine amidase